MTKYFLDKNGTPTRRIANRPGEGHLKIAAGELEHVKLQPGTDLYKAMFERGFVRVVETDSEVHVEAPRPLTRKQKEFLEDKHFYEHKKVTVNDRSFIETKSKQSLAGQIVEKLVS